MQHDTEEAHPSHFHPSSTSDELQLLLSDEPNFSSTLAYLEPLILDVLDRFVLTPTQYHEIHAGLLMDVPIAARRYLQNKRDITGGYPFSTYFTWYISERLAGLQKKSV